MNKTVIAVTLGLAVLAGSAVYLLKQKAPAGQPEGVAAAAPKKAGAGAGGGAPVSVTTVKAERRDQPIYLQATGTVSPLNTVDLKPQISSVITQVHVKEGQFVNRGELLFSLDNRSDVVNLTKAQAQLARDKAAFADAQRQQARSRDLFEQKFVSQSAVDASQTQVETQQAVLAASKAAVDAAQLNLAYNRINAPSAGRVGAINVFAGSYVQPGGNPLLTITQLDPIAVSFSLPQRNLPDALRGLREGKMPVTAKLPDGSRPSDQASLSGKLQFIDSAVDQTSGTVKVKAVFDNSQQKLWPGAYVTVSLALQTIKDAIVVPQTSILTGPRGRSVFIVAAGNKAESRSIELLHSIGSEAIVSGIEAGAVVIVDGRENVRPGSAVVERSANPAKGAEGRPKSAGSAAPGASATTTP